MARPSRTPGGMSKAVAFSAWLYLILLRFYPVSFQRTYGPRMARVFRDSCRDTWQQHGPAGLISLWLHTFFDLLMTAALERWSGIQEGVRSMVTNTPTRIFPLRLWIALVATLTAFVVSLVASLNLYLIEDTSSFTLVAYSASPLLRFSYDGIYLSALAASVAVCAIVGYALVRNRFLVSLGLGVIALLIALGGFGGLVVRHSETFLVFLAIFAVLTLSGFLGGRAVALYSGRFLGQRSAAVLGACASAGCILLMNVTILVLHTLILNPVSHALYMQGQIAGTHLNFSLIAMGIAVVTMLACALSLGSALWRPARPS